MCTKQHGQLDIPIILIKLGVNIILLHPVISLTFSKYCDETFQKVKDILLNSTYLL